MNLCIDPTLPSLLEQLKGEVKNSGSYMKVRSMVATIVEKYGVHQSYELGSSLTWHRARIVDETLEGLWYQDKYDLGARSEDSVSDYGRCHSPKASVAYLALSEDIALSEVAAKSGSYVAIATYTPIENFIVVPIGELDHYRRTGSTYLGMANRHSSQPYVDAEKEDSDRWLMLSLADAFLADVFSTSLSDKSQYLVTAALADYLFNSANWQRSIDGIIYPSVAYRSGLNLAIPSRILDKQFSLSLLETKIIYLKSHFDYGIYEKQTVAKLKSVSIDGKLEWNDK
jgi:hypothetical protein